MHLWRPEPPQVLPYYGPERAHWRRKVQSHMRVQQVRSSQQNPASPSAPAKARTIPAQPTHSPQSHISVHSDDDNNATQKKAGQDNESDGESEGGSDTASENSTPAQGGDAAPPFDILLTGYPLFEKDSAEQLCDRSFLRSFAWSHLVLDEGHAIRNTTSKRT